MEDDDLRAFRGIMIACGLGALIWMTVFLVWVRWT